MGRRLLDPRETEALAEVLRVDPPAVTRAAVRGLA
jgi:hypothetical protein